MRGVAPAWARSFTSHTLTEVTDGSGVAFAGALTGYGGSSGSWAFGVVDVDTITAGQLMMSLGFSRGILMGALDLSALMGGSGSGVGDVGCLTRISWTTLPITGQASDHWHIFALGYHWISYNDTTTTPGISNEVYLLQVDTSTGVPVVVSTVLIYSESDLSAVVSNDPETSYFNLSTNDHFLVEVPGGIAIALWCPSDTSLHILTVSATSPSTLVSDTTFAGATIGIACNTTGSARAANSGLGPQPDWEILVPDSIFPTTSSNNLQMLSTDSVFSAPSISATISDSAYNLQMATFERLANDEYVVAYKRVPTSGHYSDSSSTLVYSDFGDIILSVYHSDLSATDSTVVCLLADSTACGNRPHLSQWGRYIITCWDERTPTGGFLGAFLRIDYLSGS